MRLIMVDNDVEGIWYFTSKAKCARFIGCTPPMIIWCLKMGKPFKGWYLQEIEDDNIITKYIDPERKYFRQIIV